MKFKITEIRKMFLEILGELSIKEIMNNEKLIRNAQTIEVLLNHASFKGGC